MNELQFIDILRAAARNASPRRRAQLPGALRLLTGIGDDCAVFSASRSHDLLLTTDLFIEDVHFRRRWQTPHSVGHKVLTRGLSDIAAMGGTPRLVFLSLALPRRPNQFWTDQFMEGLLSLARQHKATLAGGDTGASPHGFVADIIVVGEVPCGRAVMRRGAGVGDEIWVSGALGGAAAELRHLRRTGKPAVDGKANPYFYPQARVAIGERLRGLASAMMDISDGLSIDLHRLTRASGVGALIDSAAIPRGAGASLREALDGGDDFELLFTVPAGKSARVPASLGGVPLTRIGRITRERGLRITRGARTLPLPVRGYQHF